ncbi:MAG: UbiA family prenyltransferase [Legionella sp.]|nr:UbiA family prenyltransferase [Legionella sp.]
MESANNSTTERRTLLSARPLVVDLDGTLIHTDMLHESVLDLFRKAPWQTLYLPFWLARGKAFLKRCLARRTEVSAASLPYNNELIEWLKKEKSAGRTLILCTASEQSIADTIAEHLDLFDEVIATATEINLSGKNKAMALERRFGQDGFDYIGNSTQDLHVWKSAHKAIVVNASSELIKKAESCCEVEHIFPAKSATIKTWGKVLRVHQWLKNLLLFIPIFSAHQLANFDVWVSLLFAFLAFSCCASSVYIANDLLDLESDRLHPRKRNRPFASGQVAISKGLMLAPILFMLSVVLGAVVGTNFLSWLLLYFTVTAAYSLGLKRIVLMDCMTLAMLYTLRIVAGAAAANLEVTFWLLGFSVFLFLSLAFVKRYAELEIQQDATDKIHGRGYYKADAPLIQTLGVSSGYAAVVILSLYLNSDAVIKLYRSPQCVWGIVPIVLFWINWMWIKAHRGEMHDDPLIFAIKDKGSVLTGALIAVVLVLGTIGWS